MQLGTVPKSSSVDEKSVTLINASKSLELARTIATWIIVKLWLVLECCDVFLYTLPQITYLSHTCWKYTKEHFWLLSSLGIASLMGSPFVGKRVAPRDWWVSVQRTVSLITSGVHGLPAGSCLHWEIQCLDFFLRSGLLPSCMSLLSKSILNKVIL